MTKSELLSHIVDGNSEISNPLADAFVGFWAALDANQPANVSVYRDGQFSERMSHLYQKQITQRSGNIGATFQLFYVTIDENPRLTLKITAGDQSWQF